MDRQVKTVYLAGPITGDPNYKEKFAAAEAVLSAAGYIVLNPAILPYPAFAHDQYMQICFAMLDACAAACFMPGWEQSPGAAREHQRAKADGKRIIYFADWKTACWCAACWCYTCASIAKCLKCGFACFGCENEPSDHRTKPKENGTCGGYMKVEHAED